MAQRKTNPMLVDAYQAGKDMAQAKASGKALRFSSFAEWWKDRGLKANDKFYDQGDAKDMWVMGANSVKRNPMRKRNDLRKSIAHFDDFDAAKRAGHLRKPRKTATKRKATDAWYVEDALGQTLSALFDTRKEATTFAQTYLKEQRSKVRDRANTELPVVTVKSFKGKSVQKVAKKFNPSLPANASANAIYAKMQELGKLKRMLENKGEDRKAQKIWMQIKALAVRHQKALGLKANSSNPSNPSKRGTEYTDLAYGNLFKKVGTLWLVEYSHRSPKYKGLKEWYPLSSEETATLKRMIANGKVVAKNPSMKGIAAKARKIASSVKRAAVKGLQAIRRVTPRGLKAKAQMKRVTDFPMGAVSKKSLEGTVRQMRAKAVNPRKVRKTVKKRNGSVESAALYEQFHGKPSKRILEIEEEWHIHKNLAQLGTLVEIKVLLNPTEGKSNQRRATLAVPHSDDVLKGVQLCSSEGAKKTLYFIGGDQSLPLKALGFTAADEKDLMYIGEVEELTYRTRKHFDKFKKIDYYHGLGEVSKVRPQLLYRPRDKKLLMAGGQYDVRPEGITN